MGALRLISRVTGLVLAFVSITPVNAQQIDGEAIFTGYCVACHSIGSGNLVGPDLKGVNGRYEEGWLLSFIKSSQTMVAEGDERAAKVFNQFSSIPMPDQPLSDDEIKALLAFIEVRTTTLDEEEKVANQVVEPVEKTPDDPGSTLATSKDPFKPFMWVIFGLFFVTITLLVTFIIALLYLERLI
jgi:mono/diheme cytochrome c family protein